MAMTAQLTKCWFASGSELEKWNVRTLQRQTRRPGLFLCNRGRLNFPGQKPTLMPRFAVEEEKQRSQEVADPVDKSTDRTLISITPQENENGGLDCIGTGLDVECVLSSPDVDVNGVARRAKDSAVSKNGEDATLVEFVLSTLLLISPFFFWGTAMVAMKGVLPKAGPMFVAATRLIPAGALLVGFASSRGKKLPAGPSAWFAIALFGLVDASCFQKTARESQLTLTSDRILIVMCESILLGFLAEGLRRTSAGLGSVIIDSQPLTVAVLASLLFGESLGPVAIVGLGLGVIGLVLLEVPLEVLQNAVSPQDLLQSSSSSAPLADGNWSIWNSGEWWMLLAAQSMAIGTVMVRWVSKFSDPVMATGWHMILGGLPLLALSVWQQDPAVTGHIQELSVGDFGALFYTSLFGSAISYGVFFYNATKGNLTKLSSLTFLTPMFAAFFGYLILDEKLNGSQLVGASVTLLSIYLVNRKVEPDPEKTD